MSVQASRHDTRREERKMPGTETYLVLGDFLSQMRPGVMAGTYTLTSVGVQSDLTLLPPLG